jgi:diguanylate cyclase
MHNKIQAKLLLDNTLENLEKHRVTPIPDNYRLWFEYAQGSLDSLNQEIDRLASSQQFIGDKVSKQLFNQFIANEDQKNLETARVSIADMLQAMVDNLKEWDTSASGFCDNLEICVSRLQGQPSIQEVNDIISEITRQALSVRNTNNSINSVLDNLSNEIASLREDVERLGDEALTDELTQIANRRGFNNELSSATEQAVQLKQPLSLIMADIDRFKRVNDEHGHIAGDKVLRYVAATISKTIRGSDFIARYGGEEFAIILPNTSLKKAKIVANNILRSVSSRKLTMGSAENVLGNITLSLGIAEFKQGEAHEPFINRADSALMRAKENGRNQAVSE